MLADPLKAVPRSIFKGFFASLADYLAAPWPQAFRYWLVRDTGPLAVDARLDFRHALGRPADPLAR